MLSYIKKRISLKYILITSATFIFVFTALFFWIARQEKQFILAQVEKQAIILHKQIVLTRQWVSDHNYILVRKRPGSPGNRFLADAEVVDARGTVYTKITPAMITRQLSDYAMQDNLYAFNLTNINSLNPENRPDEFETDAIRLFRDGVSHGLSRIEDHHGQTVFRYAAPLIVRKSCLSCHNESYYTIGKVGGCISVFIPFDEAQAAIKKNNFFLFFTMISLTGAVVIVLFLFTSKLIFKPIREIRTFTRQMDIPGQGRHPVRGQGDELKEFAGLCYVIDKKLKDRHNDLERKIEEATRDFVDTTQNLQQANKELSLLNDAKTEFLSDISHELRTPLTSIKGAADLLIRKSSCSDPAYLEIIRKNSDHLIRLIVDFLDFSKIEAGRIEFDFTRDALTDVAREAMEAQRTDAMKKNIRMVLDADEPFELSIDRYRIYQVISNLLSNAIKFSFEDREITLRIFRDDTRICFSISDQGKGIDTAHHRFIFDKFYQVPQKDGTVHAQKGSSGIGLAICKGIVHAHGGDIRVKSKKNEGSTFMFSLPADRPENKMKRSLHDSP